VISIALLFCAILMLSDLRRRSVPLADAQWYAEQWEAAEEPSTQPTTEPFDISTAAARAKVARLKEGAEREPQRRRTSGGLALIAWTRRIPRVMLPDGYAVVFRASDGVHAAWWTTDEFNERFPIESSRPGE